MLHPLGAFNDKVPAQLPQHLVLILSTPKSERLTGSLIHRINHAEASFAIPAKRSLMSSEGHGRVEIAQHDRPYLVALAGGVALQLSESSGR